MPGPIRPPTGAPPAATPEPAYAGESSVALLDRAKAGDREALNILFGRYLVPLRQWASGRLPRRLRDISDTQDLVQDVLLETFKRVDLFEPQHDEALRAYLRQSVFNRIRTEVRRGQRRPARNALDSEQPAPALSPLDAAITAQSYARYESALGRLSADDRTAIVSRLELGLSYDELAGLIGKPTPNAARVAVVRALMRLGKEMDRGR
jgi:RNA polymerase sigma-70 factor (ECF subfamily)